MLARISRLLGRRPATTAAPHDASPPVQSPVDQQIDNGVGHLHGALLPDHPRRQGEPVPRWPEHGAALMAATPDELLATQGELIQRIREISPLGTADFNRLILPAFRRFASWVHLLPASEAHHHYGPGGLLRHGFEVALHAARLAEGKHVGVDLPPSARSRYELRWRVAAMLGGLLHDLGKPLVDCGATDADRTITWPAHAGDLYSWLLANNLTHYRVYWRTGARHERHKPVGTAVTREIIGPELLAWLSDEPTQDVMSLLMMAIANMTSANNVMALVVSKADSMSVEADLKRLAKRSQGSATAGTHSAAGLIMAQLRRMVEANRVVVNRPGGTLWVVEEAGVFGAYPALLEAVVASMKRDDVPSMPANRAEIAELLADTGFIEPCVADTADGRQRSLTWDVRITLKRSGEMQETAPIKAMRFTNPELVFGTAPIHPPATGRACSPFISLEEAAKIADSVTVDATPQTAASALGDESPSAAGRPDTADQAPGAVAPSSQAGSQADALDRPGTGGATPAQPSSQDSREIMESAPDGTAAEPGRQAASQDIGQGRQDIGAAHGPGPAEPAAAQAEEAGEEPHIGDRRNRRDIASERRFAAAADQRKNQPGDLQELIKKVSKAPLFGAAFAQVLRNIYRGALCYGSDYCDAAEGLALAYPAAFEDLGMPPEDILAGAVDQRWVVTEPGSDRKVTERSFPDGSRRKCVLLGGDVGSAWEALRSQYPEVLEKRDKPAADPPPSPASATASPPVQRASPAPAPATSSATPPQRPASPPRSPPPAARAPTRPQQPANPRPAPTPPAPKQPATPRLSPIADPTPKAPPAPTEDQQKRLLKHPVVGAQAAPPAKPTTLAQPPTPPAAPDATAAPTTPPPPPAAKDRSGGSSISCALISELTPELVARINATFVLVAETMVMRSDKYDLGRPDDLKAVMRVLVEDAGVRVGPLLTALTTEANPAVLLKMPPSKTIREIKTVKMNPDYQRPDWLTAKLAKARARMGGGA